MLFFCARRPVLRGAGVVLTAFHDDEIQHYYALRSTRRREEFVASRWAAKEAAYKAFGGVSRIQFPEIVVSKQ